MDTIGGLHVQYFRREDIRVALLGNPNLMQDKKFMELFAGYLVACMLKEESDFDLMIGIPLKSTSRGERQDVTLSLHEIIDNYDLCDDTDFDVCIGDKENLDKCQVTRIVADRDENRSHSRVFDVLKKKLLVQPDDTITLIVNIEDNITIDRSEISEFIDSNEIPYGAIFVTGKAGSNAGIYRCYRIYPDMVMSSEFDIGIPL